MLAYVLLNFHAITSWSSERENTRITRPGCGNDQHCCVDRMVAAAYGARTCLSRIRRSPGAGAASPKRNGPPLVRQETSPDRSARRQAESCPVISPTMTWALCPSGHGGRTIQLQPVPKLVRRRFLPHDDPGVHRSQRRPTGPDLGEHLRSRSHRCHLPRPIGFPAVP